MQRLLSLFVALALMIVPIGMIGGAAAAHANAGPSVSEASDCHNNQPSPKKRADGPGMSAECALACTALPALQPRVEAPVASTPVAHIMLAMRPFRGANPESADPPPRI